MRTWIIAAALVVAGTGAASAQDGEGRRQRMPRTPDDFIKAADKDASGTISLDEFIDNAYERIKSMPAGMLQGNTRTAQIDKDKDGTISREELLGSPMGEERFKALDKDKNEALDRAEIEAMMAERRQGRGGRGQGQGGRQRGGEGRGEDGEPRRGRGRGQDDQPPKPEGGGATGPF